MPGLAAVVLAGGGKGAKAIKHDNKAFLEFRGEPVIIHVFRALQAAGRIGCIVVVGAFDCTKSDRACRTSVWRRKNRGLSDR